MKILQEREWPMKLSSEDITILVVLLRGHAEHTKELDAEWSARLSELGDHLVDSMKERL